MPARQSSLPKAGEVAITVRLSRDLLKRIDRWIASRDAPVSRSEAMRRLAESGLENTAVSSKAAAPSRGAERAAGMANDMIDYLEDQSATREDREQRKRRLVKGPSEFREMREEEVRARRKK
jgi:Arc/MetJ-type ribon-helix-helix transcriptional regulator